MNLMMLLEMAADGLGERIAIGSRNDGLSYRQLFERAQGAADRYRSTGCLLYTSPSPRDATLSRMPSSA